MKRGHDQAAGLVAADQRLHPFFHFPGGLVGEGDCGDMARRHAPFLNQPGDLAGDHAGFPGARASEHQQGTIGVVHSFLLAGVEFTHGVCVRVWGVRACVPKAGMIPA